MMILLLKWFWHDWHDPYSVYVLLSQRNSVYSCCFWRFASENHAGSPWSRNGEWRVCIPWNRTHKEPIILLRVFMVQTRRQEEQGSPRNVWILTHDCRSSSDFCSVHFLCSWCRQEISGGIWSRSHWVRCKYMNRKTDTTAGQDAALIRDTSFEVTRGDLLSQNCRIIFSLIWLGCCLVIQWEGFRASRIIEHNHSCCTTLLWLNDIRDLSPPKRLTSLAYFNLWCFEIVVPHQCPGHFYSLFNHVHYSNGSIFTRNKFVNTYSHETHTRWWKLTP